MAKGQVLTMTTSVTPPEMQSAEDGNRRENGQFAPGNTAGKKFESGKSGNVRGRPRGVRYLSEAFRFWLAARNELNPEATNADEIASVVGAAALSGDLKACELLLIRTEGKVKEGQWDFREPKQRIDRELSIYERMDAEQLDYSDVVELIGEERRAEIEEALQAQRARQRAQKAEQKRLAAQIAQAIAEAEAKEKAAEARRKAEEIERLAEEAGEAPQAEAPQPEIQQEEKAQDEPPSELIREKKVTPIARPEPTPHAWGAPSKVQPPTHTARESLRRDDWGPGGLRGVNSRGKNEW